MDDFIEARLESVIEFIECRHILFISGENHHELATLVFGIAYQSVHRVLAMVVVYELICFVNEEYSAHGFADPFLDQFGCVAHIL